MTKNFVLLTVILLWPGLLLAREGEIVLQEIQGSRLIGTDVHVLEDPGGKLTVEDVSSSRFSGVLVPAEGETTLDALKRFRAEGRQSFVQCDMLRPSFGFSDSAYWFRIDLSSRPDLDVRDGRTSFLLEFGYTSLDYVWMFFPDGAGGFWKYEGGDQYPFRLRQIHYKHVVYELPPFEGERVLYARVQTSGTASIPLILQTQQSFTDRVIDEQWIYGLFFGVMFVMVLYNLFVYTGTRDISYLYYVVFIACYTLFTMNLRGFAFQYLWPESIWWGHQSASFFLGGFALFGLLFTRSFLNTRETAPVLDKVMIGLMILELLIILCSLILSHQIMARVMVIGGLLFLVLAGFTGYRVLFHGYRPARFFVIALTVFFLGGLVGALSRVLLPFNFFTEQADMIGFALQVVLLSLGLADRINIMKKEKEDAQAELLESRKVMLDSFARFVPRQFLKFLGRESIVDVGLGDAVQKDFTVLFTDIRGFTTLSESMSVDENFNFLNSYLSRMGPIIHDHGGFIDKFIGDAIMALFPDRADEALHAAIEMRHELYSYNEHREQSGYPPITVGIGLHSGGLMLGTVGSTSRLDTTVIGDTVNLASRLESMTKTFKIPIIISDGVYDLLKDPTKFHIREIDNVRVKGRVNPVVVYEVFDADPKHCLESKIENMGPFNEALRAYKNGDFAAARAHFTAICEACEDDTIAAMYVRRCDKLMENPPGPKWRGISRMVMK